MMKENKTPIAESPIESVWDAELQAAFDSMREAEDKRCSSSSDVFADKVMDCVPRGDISFWVICVAAVLGMVAVYVIVGGEALLAMLGEVWEFFGALGQMSKPSLSSTMSVAALFGVLGMVFYAMLMADDYQNHMSEDDR